jgi:hypothetical protein
MSIVLTEEQIEKIIPYFWSRVSKPKKNNPKGCWLWTKYKDRDGYGMASLTRLQIKKNILAHRLSWIIHVGKIPNGRLICHSCDTPACVKFDHLWLGTPYHNNIDSRNKGRHGNFLTEAQIKQVAERYKNGESAFVLAKDYNIGHKTIYNYIYILKRKGGIDFEAKKAGAKLKNQRLNKTSGQQIIFEEKKIK